MSGLRALRARLRRPVPWSVVPLVREAVAVAVPVRRPPVLVMSMPRSGSSWVGEVLGEAPDARYLREPVTQALVQAGPERPSVFYVGAGHIPADYARAARLAMRGIPWFPPTVVRSPSDWSLRTRRAGRVVIKEINPLALGWYVEEFSPRIVYLERHPGAVAASFQRLGWTRLRLVDRFPAEVLRSLLPSNDGRSVGSGAEGFWADMGILAALTERLVDRSLAGAANVMVVSYEDMVASPRDAFQQLYAFAELQWDERAEQAVVARSNPGAAGAPPADAFAVRTGAPDVDAWRGVIGSDDLESLRDAYLDAGGTHYPRDSFTARTIA